MAGRPTPASFSRLSTLRTSTSPPPDCPLQSPPVRSSPVDPAREAVWSTGADWSGHRFITRNEGVPGSSPGVGFRTLLQVFLLRWQRLCAVAGYKTGTSSDRFMIDEGVARCPGLWLFAGSSPLAGRLPCALGAREVAASARECPHVPGVLPWPSSLCDR